MVVTLTIDMASVLQRIVLEEIPCLNYWYVLSQINPVNILKQYLFMIYFSVVLHNLHLGTEMIPFRSSGSYFISICNFMYEGWNFNSDNYLFTADTK